MKQQDNCMQIVAVLCVIDTSWHPTRQVNTDLTSRPTWFIRRLWTSYMFTFGSCSVSFWYVL